MRHAFPPSDASARRTRLGPATGKGFRRRERRAQAPPPSSPRRPRQTPSDTVTRATPAGGRKRRADFDALDNLVGSGWGPGPLAGASLDPRPDRSRRHGRAHGRGGVGLAAAAAHQGGGDLGRTAALFLLLHAAACLGIAAHAQSRRRGRSSSSASCWRQARSCLRPTSPEAALPGSSSFRWPRRSADRPCCSPGWRSPPFSPSRRAADGRVG